MKYFINILSFFNIIMFIIGMGLPITENVHKGFLDKQGDFWFGYDLVIFGSFFLIGIQFFIGFVLIILSTIISRFNKLGLITYSIFLTSVIVYYILTLIYGPKYLLGYYIMFFATVFPLIPLLFSLYNSIFSIKKVAQQVDAPEPATMVSPALQTPHRPAR